MSRRFEYLFLSEPREPPPCVLQSVRQRTLSHPMTHCGNPGCEQEKPEIG